jgi:hypothetical protein
MKKNNNTLKLQKGGRDEKNLQYINTAERREG